MKKILLTILLLFITTNVFAQTMVLGEGDSFSSDVTLTSNDTCLIGTASNSVDEVCLIKINDSDNVVIGGDGGQLVLFGLPVSNPIFRGTVTVEDSGGNPQTLLYDTGEIEFSGVSSDGTGKALCVKSDGNIGTCSDAVGGSGTCTCE